MVLLAVALALLIAAPFVQAAAKPPKAPGAVTCTSGEDGVHVSWSAVSDATSYKVWRKVGNSGPWIHIGTAETTSYVDHTSASGQRYHFAASSVGPGGESDRSGTCNITPIPFFPSLMALGAGVGAVLAAAVVILRRRRM